MKKEKTTKVLGSETSFLKQLLTNKWFLVGIGGLLLFALLSSIFIYNPKFVPEEIKGANKDVIDKVIGKDLSAKIDETRDENGATTIRTLFNLNKEENEEEHCEKKEEREQEQDKCENPIDDDTEPGKKIYRNDEFGYSVKYPENKMEIENNQLLGSQLNSVVFWDQKSYQNRQDSSYFPDFGIDVFESSKTVLEWVNDKNDPIGFISEISIQKAGQNEWVKALEAGDPDHDIYVMSKNSKIYQVTTVLEGLSYLDDVLKNFKAF